MPVTLHPLLLEVLVCPDCKSTVTLDATNSELVCDDCGLVYPIRDGIPIMLVSEARRPGRDDADAADDGAFDGSLDGAPEGDDAAAVPTDD